LLLAAWPASHWLLALGVAGLAALVTGVPTDLVPTPLFGRMTPIVWWDYPVWVVSASLIGLLTATYADRRALRARRERTGVTLGGGLLSLLAVGCPVCNKLVVLALGSSGALTYFGPTQPFLGLAAVVLLGAALAVRLRGLASCPADVRLEQEPQPSGRGAPLPRDASA
jgi:hypothetical protein